MKGVVAVVGLLAVPLIGVVPAAGAGTMSTATTTGSSEIQYRAGSGQVNSPTVSVTYTDMGMSIYHFRIDDVAPIAVSGRCTHPDADDLTVVVCDGDETTLGDPVLRIWLGDRDDSVDLRTPSGAAVPGVLQVDGGPGNDRLTGRQGTYYGRDGDDVITGPVYAHGGDGNDTLNGSANGWADDGNDRMVGSGGRNHFFAGAGNDVIYGNGGGDLLYGESGNDTIYGGPDNDQIYGGPGNDAIQGNSGNDAIQGNSGNDVISGGPGTDTISGGPGRNRITQ